MPLYPCLVLYPWEILLREDRATPLEIRAASIHCPVIPWPVAEWGRARCSVCRRHAYAYSDRPHHRFETESLCYLYPRSASLSAPSASPLRWPLHAILSTPRHLVFFVCTNKTWRLRHWQTLTQYSLNRIHLYPRLHARYAARLAADNASVMHDSLALRPTLMAAIEDCRYDATLMPL